MALGKDIDFDKNSSELDSEENIDGDFNDAIKWPSDQTTICSDKEMIKNGRCEKGPPIVCFTCKAVWTKNCKGGRLFMFGGSRPFMAKFEAKCQALLGKEDLVTLQNKSATKFGRSYICRECYLVVRQTYDNIRKIQRDVSKSIQRMKSNSNHKFESIAESENSGSDQDLKMSDQAQISPKKKLPPMAERIAKKIASLTLVRINNKTPRICLQPMSTESIASFTVSDSCVISCENGSNNHCESNNQSQLDKNSGYNCQSIEAIKDIDQCESLQINDSDNVDISLSSAKSNCNYSDEANSLHTVSYNSSSVDQNIVHENLCVTELEKHHSGDSVEEEKDKPLPSELNEILANPLLLIKSPQPVKLADVKNNQVYVCGEGNCNWIFSSRFFWENHIRHYHRSGKPFICTFNGCHKSFTGRSKLELHIRSHTDERPFICDKCGNGFRGSQELRAHRLTHTSEKPHHCVKCDKSFKLLSSLKRHLLYHDGGEFPFPCTYPECEKAFKSKYDLKCHNRLHTGERPYKCPEPGCGMAFRIPCQFTMHKRSHTGERPFKCKTEGCCAAFISSNALQAHLLSHTTERPFCCEFCGKTFKHKILYHTHLKKHSYAQNFVCPVEGCGEDHTDRKSLNQHLTSHHGIHDHKSLSKKMFECTEESCGLFYCSEAVLRYHKQKAHKTGNTALDEEYDSKQLICPYDKCERVYEDAGSLHDHLVKAHMPIPREKICPLCGQAYPHKEQLELHVNSAHKDQLDFHVNSAHNESSTSYEHLKGIFVCHSERCGLRFHRLEELKHHVTWHLGNPPYRCEFNVCNRTFLLETMYDHHIREHKNLKYFTCSFDYCPEGFTSYLKVLKHSKIHYGFFRCPVDGCNKPMQTLSIARMHLLRHEKPFVCLMCGKRFASHHQWNKHKRSHTGEKVFECKVCLSQFQDPGSLKSHKHIHKGEKLFICEECGLQFISQTLRKNHMKSHLSELPYLCSEDGCGKAFRDRNSLKVHQNMHSKPSHLCTQCGKVYKFSVSKHKCKVELMESISGELKIEYVQHPQNMVQVQPVHTSSIPSLPTPQPLPHHMPQQSGSVASSTSQSLTHTISLPLTIQQLPQTIVQTVSEQPMHQQIPMNNLNVMSESHQQPYLVEESGRTLRQNFNTPDNVVLQDAPHYNYIILYDRPIQQ
ncbi:hypothetical protein Btru_002625 [Bulinus truncatus]|nr:hypothetical protein Btru_002625 [Bulinus truncatus]